MGLVRVKSAQFWYVLGRAYFGIDKLLPHQHKVARVPERWWSIPETVE